MDRGARTFWLLVAALLGASAYFGVRAEELRRDIHRGTGSLEAATAVRVAGVLSGDALVIATDHGGRVPVRLAGVHAFLSTEKKTPTAPFGAAAQAELSRLVTEGEVSVRLLPGARDGRGRPLAHVTVADEDVGIQLIRHGLVTVSREHPGDTQTEYLLAEEQARTEHRGLWAVPAAARRADETIAREGAEAR